MPFYLVPQTTSSCPLSRIKNYSLKLCAFVEIGLSIKDATDESRGGGTICHDHNKTFVLINIIKTGRLIYQNVKEQFMFIIFRQIARWLKKKIINKLLLLMKLQNCIKNIFDAIKKKFQFLFRIPFSQQKKNYALWC